jgi:hypothetical protein
VKQKLLRCIMALAIVACGSSPPPEAPSAAALPLRETPVADAVDFEITAQSPPLLESLRPRLLATLWNHGDCVATANDHLFVGTGAGVMFYVKSPGGDGWRRTASLPLEDAVLDIAESNGVLYAASGPGGLSIIDNATDGVPVARGRLVFAGAALRLHTGILRGRPVLLVAAGHAGVLALDISRPESPEPLFHIPIAGRTYHAVLHQDTVIAAAGAQGILRYALDSKPPRLLWIARAADARALVASENELWVADMREGLIATDITSGGLRRIGNWQIAAEGARDVALLSSAGPVVAAAMGNDGLLLVMRRKDGAIEELDRIWRATPVNRLCVENAHLYTGIDNGEPQVYFFSDYERELPAPAAGP